MRLPSHPGVIAISVEFSYLVHRSTECPGKQQAPTKKPRQKKSPRAKQEKHGGKSRRPAKKVKADNFPIVGIGAFAGGNVAILNRTLQLVDPDVPHSTNLPIDYFFRSLSEDQGKRPSASSCPAPMALWV